jgi:diazepam-binding inhibitor (GABA receptor modulating acyl-CoA-binding protein)
MADLDKMFNEICAAVKASDMKPTNDEKLAAYGLFKQATDGDNTKSQPSMFQVTERYVKRQSTKATFFTILASTTRAKWTAYDSRKGLSTEEAKKQYVIEVGGQFKKYQPTTGISEETLKAVEQLSA